MRAASIEESFLLFQKENCDVLSGLRPRLLQDRWVGRDERKNIPAGRERMEGSRVIPGSFTVIKQCIGCRLSLEKSLEITQNKTASRSLPSDMI